MAIKKILLFAIPLTICLVTAVAFYQYNKPEQNVAELNAQTVAAADLFKDFASNETVANKAYLNKALQVSGVVLEVKQNQNKQMQIVLDAGDPMFGIACTLDNTKAFVKTGQRVTIKGICTGYLNDVVLIKSLLLK